MRTLLATAIALLAALALWGCEPATTETSPEAKPVTKSEEGVETGTGSDLRLNPNYGK